MYHNIRPADAINMFENARGYKMKYKTHVQFLMSLDDENEKANWKMKMNGLSS